MIFLTRHHMKSKNYMSCQTTLKLSKWALTQDNLCLGFANNTCADQPAHPDSLAMVFAIFMGSKKPWHKQIFDVQASLCSWSDLFEQDLVENCKDRCMERLDCLMMCTLYSSCTMVILLCANLIHYVQM